MDNYYTENQDVGSQVVASEAWWKSLIRFGQELVTRVLPMPGETSGSPGTYDVSTGMWGVQNAAAAQAQAQVTPTGGASLLLPVGIAVAIFYFLKRR